MAVDVILFVDTEHESGYEKEQGQWLYAARTRIKYRLEDLTNDDVYLARYANVDQAMIDRLGIRAIFLSGSSSTLDDYGEERDDILDVIRSLSLPMFGFCGGLQMIAVALDTEVALIGTDEQGDPISELGYQPTPLTGEHAMLDGISSAPVMRHSHSWELKEVPPGFGLYSSTAPSPIQMIIHDDLPVIATQFHPEYWTDEYPEGRKLIENFCHRAELL